MLGNKWLRNGESSGHSKWSNQGGNEGASIHGGVTLTANFMEIDGILSEISGGKIQFEFISVK